MRDEGFRSLSVILDPLALATTNERRWTRKTVARQSSGSLLLSYRRRFDRQPSTKEIRIHWHPFAVPPRFAPFMRVFPAIAFGTRSVRGPGFF